MNKRMMVRDLNICIKECKKDRRRRNQGLMTQVGLDGKIYAYEYVRDCLLNEWEDREKVKGVRQ